jgi:hypothetical protein
MQKRYYRLILIAVIQIVFYVSTYELGWRLGVYIKNQPRHDIMWGIMAHFALVVFVILSTLCTIISNAFFYKSFKKYMIPFIVSFVVFCLLFVNNYSYTPNKTILLLTSALVGFSSALLIPRMNEGFN